MRDLLQIVAAFEALAAEGKPAALATVVAVEGSAYRRPGARMLVAGDGRTWGTISGGCLERDVARRAMMLIPQIAHQPKKPRVICYETDGEDATEEDARPNLDPGPSLGCGGRIEILTQRITADDPGPIAALAAVVRQRKAATMATIIRTGSTDDREILIGICMTKIGDDLVVGKIPDAKLNDAVAQQLCSSVPGDRGFQIDRHTLSRGGWAEVWTQRLVPSQSLAIFGDGHDVAPLVEMAHLLGWHITVIGSRPMAALSQKFPKADHLICNPDPTADDAPPDAAVVVMGHNFRRDAAVLGDLAHRTHDYIGILGPRKRTARLLESAGISAAEENIFSPVGLDLGAETPEQIALAIVAEIQAVSSGRNGKSLRSRAGPIHLHCTQR